MSMRLPKEATCDVECAMKVESLRTTLSKKRKQSQRSEGSGGDEGSSKVAKDGVVHSDASVEGSSEGSHATMMGGSRSGSGSSKDSRSKKRFVWSEPLHQDFVAAVFDIGLKCASPKLLLEMMPVMGGLSSEHIKSHLQKYRLHRQRSREEFLKSYGYLTHLDATRAGGGSAAAAIRAASVAAVQGSIGIDPVILKEETNLSSAKGCGTPCICHAGNSRERESSAVGAGTPGSTQEGTSFDLKAGDRGESEGSVGCNRNDDFGSQGSSSGCGCDQGEGGKDEMRTTAAAGATDSADRLGDPTSNDRNVLLQTHMDLLSKGIKMQLEFHKHLQDLMEIQKQLKGTTDKEKCVKSVGGKNDTTVDADSSTMKTGSQPREDSKGMEVRRGISMGAAVEIGTTGGMVKGREEGATAVRLGDGSVASTAQVGGAELVAGVARDKVAIQTVPPLFSEGQEFLTERANTGEIQDAGVLGAAVAAQVASQKILPGEHGGTGLRGRSYMSSAFPLVGIQPRLEDVGWMGGNGGWAGARTEGGSGGQGGGSVGGRVGGRRSGINAGTDLMVTETAGAKSRATMASGTMTEGGEISLDFETRMLQLQMQAQMNIQRCMLDARVDQAAARGESSVLQTFVAGGSGRTVPNAQRLNLTSSIEMPTGGTQNHDSGVTRNESNIYLGVLNEDDDLDFSWLEPSGKSHTDEVPTSAPTTSTSASVHQVEQSGTAQGDHQMLFGWTD
ncbi:unnamed protein product [Choristocarpus tenellus]